MKIRKIEEKNEYIDNYQSCFQPISIFDNKPTLTVTYVFDTIEEEHEAYERFEKLIENQKKEN